MRTRAHTHTHWQPVVSHVHSNKSLCWKSISFNTNWSISSAARREFCPFLYWSGYIEWDTWQGKKKKENRPPPPCAQWRSRQRSTAYFSLPFSGVLRRSRKLQVKSAGGNPTRVHGQGRPPLFLFFLLLPVAPPVRSKCKHATALQMWRRAPGQAWL